MRLWRWIGHSGQRGDRGAVGNGEDALVLADAVGVDLGDHQRHVRIHPEGGGVVDDHGAGLHRERREFAGNAAAGREQRDIDALEGALVKLFDDHLLAAKIDGLAGRACARQRLELTNRKGTSVHGGDEFGADGAGHADDGNNGIVRHFGLLFV
jgi:hypothetical protein